MLLGVAETNYSVFHPPASTLPPRIVRPNWSCINVLQDAYSVIYFLLPDLVMPLIGKGEAAIGNRKSPSESHLRHSGEMETSRCSPKLALSLTIS